MEEKAKAEIERITQLLAEFNVSERRIDILKPVIENTAFMKAKLDETKELIKSTSVVIPYDNGGGQQGIRENPIFKGYESLWKSYMNGMNTILAVLPNEVIKEEKQKVVETRTMLELVRDKHRKEA